MEKIADHLITVLVLNNISGNVVYLDETVITKFEWENEKYNFKFATMDTDKREEKIKDYINSKIEGYKVELEKIDDVMQSSSLLTKKLIRAKKINLISKNKKIRNNLKKFIARKNYLEKRIDKFGKLKENMTLKINKIYQTESDLKIYNKGKEIDKNSPLVEYYLSKIVNSDNEFKIYFLIEKKLAIPTRVIHSEDGKITVSFSIDQHIGNDKEIDLIDLNKVLYDGTIIGSKYVAFKKKEDLIYFLKTIKNNVNDSYESAIKSLK